METEARIISTISALAGFAVAVVSGLMAQNTGAMVLLRAIIAMFVCAVVGRGVGWVLRRVYDEHTANYQAAVPIPRVPSMSELQSTGSPPDVGT